MRARPTPQDRDLKAYEQCAVDYVDYDLCQFTCLANKIRMTLRDYLESVVFHQELNQMSEVENYEAVYKSYLSAEQSGLPFNRPNSYVLGIMVKALLLSDSLEDKRGRSVFYEQFPFLSPKEVRGSLLKGAQLWEAVLGMWEIMLKDDNVEHPEIEM